MNPTLLFSSGFLLSLFPSLARAEEQKQAASSGGGLADMLPMFVIMGALFYFMILRPQNKEKKQREEMLNALQKNDHVVTHSGIYGVVANVAGDDVVLKVDESKDVRIKFAKSAIARKVSDEIVGKEKDKQ